MPKVIYEGKDVQIIGYENGARGKVFELYENGIDIDKGGQLDFSHEAYVQLTGDQGNGKQTN